MVLSRHFLIKKSGQAYFDLPKNRGYDLGAMLLSSPYTGTLRDESPKVPANEHTTQLLGDFQL